MLKEPSLPTKTRIENLHELFSCEPEGFWQTHYHFRQKTAGTSSIRLGSGRVNDILVNTIVPVALLCTRIFRVASIGRNTRSLLTALPALQENSVTAIIQSELTREIIKLSSAVLQQGAIQLYKAYCVSVRCHECAMGRRAGISFPEK